MQSIDTVVTSPPPSPSPAKGEGILCSIIARVKDTNMKLAGLAVLLTILCAALPGCRKAEPRRADMIFETIVVGELGVNCYLLADSETKEGIVIDPGAEPGKILSAIKAHGIKVLGILNTH